MEGGSEEDNARTGVATEEMHTDDIEGDVPMTTSAIVDIAGVSQPSQDPAYLSVEEWCDYKCCYRQQHLE